MNNDNISGFKEYIEHYRNKISVDKILQLNEQTLELECEFHKIEHKLQQSILELSQEWIDQISAIKEKDKIDIFLLTKCKEAHKELMDIFKR